MNSVYLEGFTVQPSLADNMVSPYLSFLCVETRPVSIYSVRIASFFHVLIHRAQRMDTLGSSPVF